MAVVNSNTYQDEEDDQPNGNASPARNGTANLAQQPVSESEAPVAAGNSPNISSGVSGTSVNTATPGAPSGNANANASGSWTNLNDYLNANNGASNNLGSRVLNTVNQAAQQGTGIINSAAQNFQGDVSKGTDVYNPQLSQDALAAPSAFLQNPEYTSLVNELTGSYGGPSDWGTSTEAASATSGEQNAEQTAGLGLTSQGRQQLLRQTAASPYTQGESSLNSFLLDNNPSQLQPITQAANIGGNLQGQFQNAAQTAGNQVTAAQNTSAATGQQAKSDILGGQTSLVNTLTNQATQNAANTTAQGKTIGTLLNNNSAINDTPIPAQSGTAVPAPQLTSAEIQSLGISPDQYNQLIALNQQVLGLGAPGINFGSFYQAPDVSGYSPAAEATNQQVSDFNALNQLVPGSNQQFLSGATGTPLSTNGTFDYQSAITALQAQLQAAQENAAQQGTAGQATYGGQSAAQVAGEALGGIGGLATLINIGGKLYNLVNGKYQAVQPDPTQAQQNANDSTLDQGDNEQANNDLNGALTNPPPADTGDVIAPPAGTVATNPPPQNTAVTVQDTGQGTDENGNPISDAGTVGGAAAAAATGAAPAGTVAVQSASEAAQAANDAAQAAAQATAQAGITGVSDASVAQLAQGLDSGSIEAANQAAQQSIDSLADVAPENLSSAASSTVSNLTATLGTAAAVYGIYNFINNWQSGATGSDAMNGASAGAAIGTMFDEFTFGLGTVIGAVIGAAVGAISSAFGGGKSDPETEELYAYDQAYNANPSIANNNSPADNFQILAGVFDAKNPTPGHSTAIEQIFGRMQEGSFVSQMTNKINQAIQSGQVPPQATAAQLYQSVVDPWLASYTGNYGGGQTTGQILPGDADVNGNEFGNALVASITNLIGQWQTGAFSGSTPVGVDGQTMGSQLPAYVGNAAGTGSTPYVAPPPAAPPTPPVLVNNANPIKTPVVTAKPKSLNGR